MAGKLSFWYLVAQLAVNEVLAPEWVKRKTLSFWLPFVAQESPCLGSLFSLENIPRVIIDK